MGSWIAAAALQHDVAVVLADSDNAVLDAAADRIDAWLSSHPVGRRSFDLATVRKRLRTTDQLEEVARCDLVVEAVKEDVFVKQPLLSRLEGSLGAGSVLSTNTSTLGIDRLAEGLADPSRFCGCHFFLPLGQVPVLEIIRGTHSRPEAVGMVVALAQKTGYVPLVVRDAPGFVLNRLMLPYLCEALQLLGEGVSMAMIEETAVEFGMNIGPLRLCDEIGTDTVLNCGFAMLGSSEDLVVRSPLLVGMVKRGRLGRKSGAGFFAYGSRDAESGDGAEADVSAGLRDHTLSAFPPPPPGCPDPEMAAVIDRWRGEPRQHTEETILTRLFIPVLLEATRMLDRGSVRGPEEIDLAAAMFGFPPSRGGLLYWADSLGGERVVQMARSLDYLGQRCRPTPRMLDMAASGDVFYPDSPAG
jgi:3-hydroxyacyl-CoA dehydrogenase/enoyl-CoA hydratase/3-hydroxybutyryl-CoA epimerase/3-hydroxyacyl-CoA dehydrogenase/enoyl-CoA hydratase/3-hydroxybutyryl-CoA epimerase/enoyl-CoA isomerase